MKIEAVTTLHSAREDDELSTRHERLLNEARKHLQGAPEWDARKEAEVRELLLLSQRAPAERLRVISIDMRETLRVEIVLNVPVACLPNPNGSLLLARHATLGILYPREVLSQTLPGFALVTLLDPHFAWYPNVRTKLPQQLCLGDRIPVNISLRELVLLSYGLLSMQNVMLDEHDSIGVMNLEAAQWWQRNTKRMPLTTTGFFETDASLEGKP